MNAKGKTMNDTQTMQGSRSLTCEPDETARHHTERWLILFGVPGTMIEREELTAARSFHVQCRNQRTILQAVWKNENGRPARCLTVAIEWTADYRQWECVARQDATDIGPGSTQFRRSGRIVGWTRGATAPSKQIEWDAETSKAGGTDLYGVGKRWLLNG